MCSGRCATRSTDATVTRGRTCAAHEHTLSAVAAAADEDARVGAKRPRALLASFENAGSATLGNPRRRTSTRWCTPSVRTQSSKASPKGCSGGKPPVATPTVPSSRRTTSHQDLVQRGPRDGGGRAWDAPRGAPALPERSLQQDAREGRQEVLDAGADAPEGGEGFVVKVGTNIEFHFLEDKEKNFYLGRSQENDPSRCGRCVSHRGGEAREVERRCGEATGAGRGCAPQRSGKRVECARGGGGVYFAPAE